MQKYTEKRRCNITKVLGRHERSIHRECEIKKKLGNDSLVIISLNIPDELAASRMASRAGFLSLQRIILRSICMV